MQAKQTGVYAIVHKATGKPYIGSASQSFAIRWTRHRKRLRTGKHHSRHLQAAWDKYGEAAFEFRVMEVTPPEDAVAMEQVWIDFYNSADRQHGYNIAPKAGSTRGVKITPEARKAISERTKAQFSTPESREAASERSKRIQGAPEARRANSEQAKARMSTPEARKAASERMKAKYSTPESRKEQSERQKIVQGTPESRKEKSEQQKIIQGSPEIRKAHGERRKAMLADPIRRAAWIAKCRATRAATRDAKRLAYEPCDEPDYSDYL